MKIPVRTTPQDTRARMCEDDAPACGYKWTVDAQQQRTGITQVWGHQEQLLTIALEKVLGYDRNGLNPRTAPSPNSLARRNSRDH
jgi:hypothetical protein